MSVSATIINIPDDYSTIQAGIDASDNGDTVLVQPGTYVENVNFNGHNIVLGSLFLITGDLGYVSQTIIDGNSFGSVIIFQSGENFTASIIGLKIRNGYSAFGAGINCFNSNPTISHNIISENYAGGGHMNRGNGGGIRCTASDPLIEYNFIYGNLCTHYGGGIDCNNSNPIISNNIIYGNGASRGGGVISGNSSNPVITNTIIWANNAQYGSGLYTVELSSLLAIYCDIQDTLWPGEGNISVDPLFRDLGNGDLHLMATYCGDPYDSPCIDAGHPDILDALLDCSWGLGEERSDMGAYGGGEGWVRIDQSIANVPQNYMLFKNYPNPFNISTMIKYELPQQSQVTIEIYDILGRKVSTLKDGSQPAGYHRVIWQAEGVASGIYFYRLKADDYIENKKMVLVK